MAELPHQILEELGRLCSFRDLLAARSTCRAWRSFLTQQAFSHGSVLRVSACPNAQAFNRKAHALAHIFPGIKELVLHVGSRVTKDALNKEVAGLAVAFPGLESLAVQYIQPCSTKFDDTPTVTVMGGWLLPVTDSLTAHDPVPGGLTSFSSLRSLKLKDVRTPPGPLQLKRLPTMLTTLSIGTADVLDGLGDVGTGPLPIGPNLPHLLHLQVDVRCGRAAGAGGLAGLSKGLRSLELHGVIDLGEPEVKALCDLTHLQHLSVQVPCDQYHAASKLLTSHPSLTSLALTLNQDESQLDFHESFTTDMGTILLHLLEEANTAQSTHAQQCANSATANGTLHNHQPRSQHHSSMNDTRSSDAWSPAHSTQASHPYSSTYSHNSFGSSSSGSGNGSSSWQHQGVPYRLPPPHACNPLACLTSLTLQSCSLQHAAGAPWGCRGSSFMDLVACLTGLQSLHIEEPLPLEFPLRGSLMQLTVLTNLRSLAILLMAGLPIPALTITPELAPALAASCPHLSELTALNAIQPDESGSFSFLTALTGLHTLALSPCSPRSSGSGSAHNTQHSSAVHDTQHSSMHGTQHAQHAQHSTAHIAADTAQHGSAPALWSEWVSSSGDAHYSVLNTHNMKDSLAGRHRMPLLDLSRDLPLPHLEHLHLMSLSIMASRTPCFAHSLRSLMLSNCELLGLKVTQLSNTHAASSSKQSKHTGESPGCESACASGARVAACPNEGGLVSGSGLEGQTCDPPRLVGGECDAGAAAAGSQCAESLAEGVQTLSLDVGQGALQHSSTDRGDAGGCGGAAWGDVQQQQGHEKGQGQQHQHQQQQVHETGLEQQKCQEQSAAPPVLYSGQPHMPGALSPAQLLAGLSGLQSLQLIQVDGVTDATFPHLSTLNSLTSLRLLPAPTPPLPTPSLPLNLNTDGTAPDPDLTSLYPLHGKHDGPTCLSSDAWLMKGGLPGLAVRPHPPRLSQAGLAHCSCLTELRTLDWACWAGDVSPHEPHFVRQLAMGAKSLHVLSLAPTQEPEVRASTLEVVQRHLPLCVVDENVPL